MRLALLGAGISRSSMPRLQHHLGSLVGVEIDYGLIDGENYGEADPCALVRQSIEQGYHGLNVTHPYKQKVHNLVREPAIAGHDRIGSYNTLKFTDRGILGANTDYSGFIRGYRFRRGEQLPGHVVMCGAGGVGSAIAFGLLELGCEHLSIYDLQPSQADALASKLRQFGGSAEVLEQSRFPDVARSAHGLVNCTALGMHSYPGNAFPFSVIGSQQWAFDAVYTPLKTEFLMQCQQAGLQCLSGFDLWIFQGLDAFSVFTGVDIEADETLIETALSWLD
ncbi:shikimate dehydrogenase [Parahaliea maris]|uniref:Shikimate dehydrogenase n=1 Tax=Parahaliea maris TaxID=2716870 RepID=A0A5C8ZRF5_9GAMM|nr:shikimate dehydrogenase [Parahaliea maris]TXS90240.1 shikimate dehydrogenase [Parahaliea maris]